MKPFPLNSEFRQRIEKFLLPLIFVFALVVRLVFDLIQSDQRLCSFGDGYFFLKTGQELAKAMTTSTGLADFLAKLTVHTTEVAGSVATFGSGALGDRLLLDGPIYTFFLAIVHIISGIVNTTDYANNSKIICVANSIVDALSCVLLYVCGRLSFGRRAGLVAALLLAVYPASILNTRLAYSELFTYFLLLLWSALALGLRNSLPNTGDDTGATAKSADGERSETGSKSAATLVLAFLLGSVSVLILLARSFFAPLPALGLIILFATKRRVGKLLPAASTLIAGAAIVMAPWLWFTHEVTGKYLPWVNRAPGYNLFVGNQLDTDGWRTWPAQSGIPNEAGEAVRSISKNFSTDPVQFSALILRKVSRLWAGVWNDFQHRIFGIPWQAQNVFHDLILLFGSIGFIISMRRSSRTRRPGLVFALFAIYHSLYACFEPVARYAITAMPFLSLLAAYCLTLAGKASSSDDGKALSSDDGKASSSKEGKPSSSEDEKHLRDSNSAARKPCCDKNFWALTVFAGTFFALLNMHVSLIPLLFAILPTDQFLPIQLLGMAVWVLLWGVLGFAVHKFARFEGRLQRVALSGATSVLALISIANFVFDPARSEWSAELKSEGDSINCELELPATTAIASGANGYLLIDMQSCMPAPAVKVSINNHILMPPMPVLQLMQGRDDASEVFALQAQAMTMDPRAFRHWWAFPLPVAYLDSNRVNVVSIRPIVRDGKITPVKVFGNYPDVGSSSGLSGGTIASTVQESCVKTSMPSINKFSWVKGFVTIDRRDPRPYEVLTVRGVTRNCEFRDKTDGAKTDGNASSRNPSSRSDLSARLGRQFGAYRVRLYMPPHTAAGASPSSSFDPNTPRSLADATTASSPTAPPSSPVEPQQTVFERKEESLVTGGDPSTMNLTGSPVSLSLRPGLLNCAYSFSCELQPTKQKTIGGVSITFKGKDERGHEVKWTSPWTPAAMRLESGDWQTYSFTEMVPEEVATARDITVSVLCSPFAADRLFLHRKNALRDSVKVRNVSLRFLHDYAPKITSVDDKYLY